MTLLERDDLLATLREQWRSACAGAGRLVLVEGEAGIGKTSLLRAFAKALPADVPRLWGACDALIAPRPLAVLEDFAAAAGDGKPELLELRTLLTGGAPRHRLFVAWLELLAARPTLAVLEDLHWADEATLDLLRYAGRRIARTHSLLLASFRSDELVPTHPLRTVLGDLATSGARRLSPAPLSLAAVRALCEAGAAAGDEGRIAQAQAGTEVAAELHRLTAGNPFFVTEVLAAGARGGPATVPATVQDAVLARAARLSASARAVLDAAAVAGPRVEPWLLHELTAAESVAIDECLATGVLRAEGIGNTGYTFRHELARQSVLQAMSPARAASLHRLVLQALLTVPAAPVVPAPGLHAAQTGVAAVVDAARLARHADGAGDAAAVRRWAPVAAREAAARGAHRQAAAQWALAARLAGADSERAPLLDEHASEAQMAGGLAEAIASRREAARLWRQVGESGRAAVSLARLALFLVLAGRNAEGEAVLREAQALVAQAARTPEAMEVQRCAAGLRMLDRDCDEAVALATPALAAAEAAQDTRATQQGLVTLGAALLVSGAHEAGIAHLERGLALAEQMHHDQGIGLALANLGSGCGEMLMFESAEGYLKRGIAFCAERDLDAQRLYQLAWLAIAALHLGRWDEAATAALEVVAEPRRAAAIARIMALIALGTLRARRGDPGVWSALDEARDLASGTGTLQRTAPMHAARAEAAWLEGRFDEAVAEAAAGLPLALAKRHGRYASELTHWGWRGRAGVRPGAPTASSGPSAPSDPSASSGFSGSSESSAPSTLGASLAPGETHPFALESAGHWHEAAAAWQVLGCPFERARALADGDEAAQREALAVFESLGARPMVERVRHQLRAAGVRGLPRGPRASTREHPAGLTSKEVAVLALLAEGLRNKEIAQRLSRSARTVDHHVEAIFVKLGVATRAEAVSAAHRLGVVDATASLRPD